MSQIVVYANHTLIYLILPSSSSQVAALEIKNARDRTLPESYDHDNELLEYELKFIMMAYESKCSLRKSHVNYLILGRSSPQVAALESDRKCPRESYGHDNELLEYELKFIIMAYESNIIQQSRASS